MAKHLLIVDEGEAQPRNLRQQELAEVIEGALVELIGINRGERNLLEWVEARLIHLALEQARHNKSNAARQLGMPRKRLERRARKYQQDIVREGKEQEDVRI
jgi:transcriptional regulator with AAA-type ATPase domain